MSKIKTPQGVIKFTPIPLFPGVKQINPDIALDNLLILKDFFEMNGIEYMLAYGTLLGAAREHDFIVHDEDVDIAIKDEFRIVFLSKINQLMSVGFKLVRYDRRDLFSLMRQGEYVDLYFFRQIDQNLRECSGMLLPQYFFGKTEIISFHSTFFTTHSNYLDFLLFEYGKSWNIPCKWNNYSMSKIKRFLLIIKEYVKDYLPDWLYFRLGSNSYNRILRKSRMQINNYKKIKEI